MRIIGIGNAYRSDDAAGLIAARRLRAALPESIAVIELSGEGTALMNAWKEAGPVIVIDALSSTQQPGAIRRFAAHVEPIPAIFFSYSTHAFGLAEAIELGRVLGELPEQLIVYGIEGKDFRPGTEVSPEAEAAIEDVIRRVTEDVQGMSHA